MASHFQNYIDGSWTDATSDDTFEVRNPADTSDVVGVFQNSNEEDARKAISAAVAATEEWADTPGPVRGRILRQAANVLADRKDEIAEKLTREEGKPIGSATGEVQRTIDIFYYYAEKARDHGGDKKNSSSRQTNLYTVHEPVGVTALITPWNYPIAIPAWKLAPALATGNTAVLKPAKQAPTVGTQIFECLDKAGLPNGVANLVTGPGRTVGDELVTNDDVDAVSFTGSATVGQSVYTKAMESAKRAQCEMGGKNPTVVMPSADLDEAVEIVGTGAFGVTGQACTACSRAVVHEDVSDEFLEGIVDYAESLEVGPGLEGYDMGPHVSDDELQGTLEYVSVGVDEGATLETGGEALERGRFSDGFYIEPTVFSGVTPEMRIAQEEIFGPFLSVLEVGTFDEAVEVANGVEYGLSASIVTEDHTEANRFVDAIEAGVAKINEKTTGLELHVPFGGFKRSSTETFREQGDSGMQFYTLSKTVYDGY